MNLESYSHSGEKINSNISSKLIEGIFFKDSPLHDGAILIQNNKIVSARCILPITERIDLPDFYGTRHRAAIGMSEITDAFIIVISEENGAISLAYNAELKYNVSTENIKEMLNAYFNLI
jgi:DNA integrity scanning protein DisA with diadenylate cyclase activity